jgi:hypothetical protein
MVAVRETGPRRTAKYHRSVNENFSIWQRLTQRRAIERRSPQPSGVFPSHADPPAVSISPDHAAGPKRVAVVKRQIEDLGQVCDNSGIHTHTCTKRG